MSLPALSFMAFSVAVRVWDVFLVSMPDILPTLFSCATRKAGRTHFPSRRTTSPLPATTQSLINPAPRRSVRARSSPPEADRSAARAAPYLATIATTPARKTPDRRSSPPGRARSPPETTVPPEGRWQSCRNQAQSPAEQLPDLHDQARIDRALVHHSSPQTNGPRAAPNVPSGRPSAQQRPAPAARHSTTRHAVPRATPTRVAGAEAIHSRFTRWNRTTQIEDNDPAKERQQPHSINNAPPAGPHHSHTTSQPLAPSNSPGNRPPQTANHHQNDPSAPTCRGPPRGTRHRSPHLPRLPYPPRGNSHTRKHQKHPHYSGARAEQHRSRTAENPSQFRLHPRLGTIRTMDQVPISLAQFRVLCKITTRNFTAQLGTPPDELITPLPPGTRSPGARPCTSYQPTPSQTP